MLEVGTAHEKLRPIVLEDCITFLGDDVPPSLATPRMILWMEYACRDGALGHLDEGQDTVGVHVDVRHHAASPLGAEVRFRAEVTEVDGRKVTFRVEAWDGETLVGDGTHRRFIVDIERFAARLKKELGNRGAGE